MSENRPRTHEELAALPIGPAFGFLKYQYTEEDQRRGFCMLRGKRINIVTPAKSIMIPVEPDVVADFVGPDDILGFVHDGENWTIGRYADGRYFRQRAP